MSDLTAVSLFAGIGGIDRAIEQAGAKVTAAVEIDSDCRGVLRRHFPGTAIFNDVTEVTGDQLRATGFVPERGVLAGGWPCQGNSVAGRRGGLADPRSGMWRHVVRLLDETRPRWFLGENVPGLLSVNGGRDFGTVLGDLDELGYGVAWRVLDAQWFGVPQRRRRVFLVGCLGDPLGPVEVLLEPESGDGHPAAGREAGPGTAAPADGGPVSALQGGGRRGHRIDAEGAAGGHLIAAMPLAWRGRDGGSQVEAGRDGDPMFCLRASKGGGTAGMPMVTTFGGEGVVHALTSEGADASEDGTGRGTPIVAVPMAFNPQNSITSAPNLGYGETPASVTTSKIMAVHQEALVRRLSPLECERLQGFPDGWTGGQSDSARYRQLGNSVAVPCVEWITRRLVAADSASAETRGAA